MPGAHPPAPHGRARGLGGETGESRTVVSPLVSVRLELRWLFSPIPSILVLVGREVDPIGICTRYFVV